MAGNLCLVCESSDLLTLPLLNCDWQAESREINISAPDGSARSGFSGNGQPTPVSPNISPLLLKCCHNELSGVYQHLFQLSINSGIPRIWKTAVIVPVPKKTAAKE